MRLRRPVLVTFIGDINLLCAFLIIVSFFTMPQFIEAHGISFIPISDYLDLIIRVLKVICLLSISYGFLRLKRWGYGMMIGYNLFFLIISMIFIVTKNRVLGNIGDNFIGSLLGLIITFLSKRYFIKKNEY